MGRHRGRRRRGPKPPPPPPGLEVGAEVEVEITDIAPKGDGIGEVEGKRLYAARTIPGERLRVRIRRHRREWIAVDVLSVERPSPDRVEPRCPLFGPCSGCQLQHVAYPRQLELKREIVRQQLREHGGFADPPVAPVLGADDPWHYRNHGRFTVQDGQLGFVRHFRRELLPVPHCYIMEPGINEVLETLQGRLHGATQCNVRVGKAPGARMIQPRLTEPPDAPPSGQTSLEDELLGHRFRISAAAFFQVNRAQAERMVTLVRERTDAGPQGVVVDAYAGVGTFAVLLAPHVGKVIAIEESGPAVEDARFNARAQGLGDADIELRLGKTEEVLGTLSVDPSHDPSLGGGQAVDAIILDPPRSGCQPAALQAVVALGPRRVVYVSCEPETLARDLRVLVDADPGWSLLEVQPIDMFPHTHHIECVATLERKGAPSAGAPAPRRDAIAADGSEA